MRLSSFHQMPRRWTAALFLAVVFSTGCSTYVKIPVVTYQPPKFNETMQGGKRIGIVALPAKSFLNMTDLGNYSAVMQGAVVNAIQKYRYFTLVDIASRKARAEQIALSRSGLTRQQQALGKELAIDGLLILEVPTAPRHECRFSSRMEKRQDCTRTDHQNRCLAYADRTVQVNTATLTMSVVISGRLVNLETGAALSYQAASTDPPPQAQQVLGRFAGRSQAHTFVSSVENGPASCPSVVEAFSAATEAAAAFVVHHLSPRVQDYRVVIEDSTVGVPKNQEDNVKGMLKNAIKWINTHTPNFERATEIWKQVLDTTQGKSAAALWNLAVVYWSRGELSQAADHFKRAQTAGGPDFFKGEKVEAYNRFVQERARIEQRMRKSWRRLMKPPAEVSGNQRILL